MVVVENVPAGSVLSDLGFFCRDEAHQPVHGGILGKVQLSWSRGSKNVVLEEGIVCLPDMPVSCDSHVPLYCTAPVSLSAGQHFLSDAVGQSSSASVFLVCSSGGSQSKKHAQSRGSSVQ